MRLYEFFTNLYEISDAVKKRMREKFKQADQNLTDEQVNYYLDRWDRYSNNFPSNKKDITRLSFREVEQLIDSAEAAAKLKGRGHDKQEQTTDWIYNKDNIVIFKGDSKQKCMNYGKGYSWCISRADASNMFNSYRFDGKDRVFYYVFDKNLPTDDPWHAIVVHVLGSGQLKVTTAANDKDYDTTWEELLQKKPRLKLAKSLFVPSPPSKEERDEYQKFKEIADNIFETPEPFLNLSLRDKIEYIEFGFSLSDEIQDVLPKNLLSLYVKNGGYISWSLWARLSLSDFKYAIKRVDSEDLPSLSVVQDDAEKTKILKNEILNCIKNQTLDSEYIENFESRWSAAEPVIMRNPEWAYRYARKFFPDGWPEAEPYIMKYPFSAYAYARDALKRRWPEAEPYIMKDSYSAYQYAKKFLPRGWPEAEPYIMKSPEWAYWYAREFFPSGWPEAEPYIMKDPSNAFYYAKNILRRSWPEAEPYISTDLYSWNQYKEHFGIK